MTKITIEQFIEIYNNIADYPTIHTVALAIGLSESQIRRKAAHIRAEGIRLIDRSAMNNLNKIASVTELDEESKLLNLKLAKQLQRTQDLSRVKDKNFRETVRLDNTVAELNRELIQILQTHSVAKQTKFHQTTPDGGIGIIHWSDQHLNEMVELDCNQFNWEVGGRRLRKHVMYVKKLAKAFGVKTLLVAMTGDLLNSDRRLDEILTNSTNRANATYLASILYQQALLDLNEDFNLTVASVSGNESRVHEEYGWTNSVVTDNYDTTIYNMLRFRFQGAKGITFLDNCDTTELVVNVGNQNVLLLHGHGAIDNNRPEKSVQQLKGRYTAHNVHIDLVIWGHVHSALVGDQFARSSSLVGANDYSEKALNLSGRASQNFYILNEDGGFHGIKIDLQNTEGVEGYSLDKQLEAYNTKSHTKLHTPVTIHKVVV